MSEGVLVTGGYGVGKSSVVEEMATILERAGAPYAALDLDWLCWFDVPGVDRPRAYRVLCANVSAVVGNYVAAGVERFLLALAVRDQAQVAELDAAVPFPLSVVRLVAPPAVVEARLSASVTSGRIDDLEEARRWLVDGVGEGVGDVVVDADRPISEVAGTVLSWLGWTVT